MLFYSVAVLLLPIIPARSNIHRRIAGLASADYGYGNQLSPYGKFKVNGYTKLDNTNDREYAFINDEEAMSSEAKNNADSRRIFGWFSSLLKTTTESGVQSNLSPTESTYDTDMKEHIILEELYRNLSDALSKISDIQKRVNELLERRNSYTVVTKGGLKVTGTQNPKYNRKRAKREAELDTESPASDRNDAGNATGATEAIITATDCPCGDANNASGRRFAPTFKRTEIKSKLLAYLDESFSDVQNKMKRLQHVKDAFREDYGFRIGYIVANIDTLELNLMNMKNNTDRNKEFWEDKKILELYDTLKVSDQAVTGLIESLKMYIGQLSNERAQLMAVKDIDLRHNVQSKQNAMSPTMLDLTR